MESQKFCEGAPISGDVRSLVALGIASVYWMLMAGIGLPQVIVSLSVLYLISGIGLTILQLLSSDLSRFEIRYLVQFGPGLGVGLFCVFIIRTLLPNPYFLPVFCVVFLIQVFVVLRQIIQKPRSISQNIEKFAISSWFWQVPGFVALFGCVLLGEWFWVFPITVGAFLVAVPTYHFGSRYPRSIIALNFIVIGLTTILVHSIQEKRWWNQIWGDDDWFQLTSHALFEWGPLVRSDIKAQSGFQSMAYHHLAYFFNGILDFVWRTETNFSLTTVLPILLVISVLASTILFSVLVANVATLGARAVAPQIFGFAAFVLAAPIFDVPSNTLAASLVVGSVSLVSVLVRIRGWRTYFSALVLLFGSAVFAKTTYLYPLIVVFTMTALSIRGSRRNAIPPVIVGVLLLLFFKLFSGAVADTLVFDPFSGANFGELAVGGFGSKAIAVLAAVGPFSVGAAAGLFLLTGIKYRNSFRYVGWALLVTVSIGAISSLLIDFGYGGSKYIQMPARISGSLLLLMVAPLVVGVPKKQVKAGVFLGGFIWVFWFYVIGPFVPDLNSGSAFAKALRLLRNPESAGLGLLLVAVAAWIVLGVKSLGFNELIPAWLGGVGMVTCLSVSASVGLLKLVPVTQERFLDSRSGMFDEPDSKAVERDDIRRVSDFLREKTPKDTLVAYSLCGDDLKVGCPPPLLFAAHSQRQFLHLGSFSDYWGFSSQQEERDFSLSVGLAEGVSESEILQLKARGVQYLLIDLSRIPKYWIANLDTVSVKEVYSSSRFAVLKMP
jgi:hypothetical protein